MVNSIPTASKSLRPTDHDPQSPPADLLADLASTDDDTAATDDNGDSGGDAGTKGTGSAG
jgi:hypothetical protein